MTCYITSNSALFGHIIPTLYNQQKELCDLINEPQKIDRWYELVEYFVKKP